MVVRETFGWSAHVRRHLTKACSGRAISGFVIPEVLRAPLMPGVGRLAYGTTLMKCTLEHSFLDCNVLVRLVSVTPPSYSARGSKR